ncbi:MAG: glycosyltransferase [Planctomycetota bacterium]
MTSPLLSIIIPCFNEASTLRSCVDAVLGIADDTRTIEVIIVDDASTDDSPSIAGALSRADPRIHLHHHAVNRGKGAALRTGFAAARGSFVAVQDADLEYDPRDLIKLLQPLIDGEADVVLGSRFLTTHARRVLLFWHTMGNKFLTLLSNMLTDMNLTDMETCYKVFRREVIQSIDLVEDRFGFEPEVVAKLADRRLRVYEMGISYRGRTYEEGKKIGIRDGFRALYCIIRYNAHRASLPAQFAIYLFIGGTAAIFNLLLFLILFSAGMPTEISAAIAFVAAALLNYVLCVRTLFQAGSRWNRITEFAFYALVVVAAGIVDVALVTYWVRADGPAGIGKMLASFAALSINFLGRRYLVFSQSRRGPWSRRRLR